MKKNYTLNLKILLANFLIIIYYFFKNIGKEVVQHRKKFINNIRSLWCRGEFGRVLTKHGLALFCLV